MEGHNALRNLGYRSNEISGVSSLVECFDCTDTCACAWQTYLQLMATAHSSAVALAALGKTEDLESAANLAKKKFDKVMTERQAWRDIQTEMQATMEPVDSEWFETLRATHASSSKRKSSITAGSPSQRASKRNAGSS